MTEDDDAVDSAVLERLRDLEPWLINHMPEPFGDDQELRDAARDFVTALDRFQADWSSSRSVDLLKNLAHARQRVLRALDARAIKLKGRDAACPRCGHRKPVLGYSGKIVCGQCLAHLGFVEDPPADLQAGTADPREIGS